jgi:hypothetical protein
MRKGGKPVGLRPGRGVIDGQWARVDVWHIAAVDSLAEILQNSHEIFFFLFSFLGVFC